MSEFEDNKEIYAQAKRGTYIIIPLPKSVTEKIENNMEKYVKKEVYESGNFSSLIAKKCRNEKFVRRYKFDMNTLAEEELDFVKDPKTKKSIPMLSAEFFAFENGISFLALFYAYDNKDTRMLYRAIQPGYINEESAQTDIVINKIVQMLAGDDWKKNQDTFNVDITDTILFNVAFVGVRFKCLETLDRLTDNVHKIIELEKNFVDKSEKDVAYTYGARDVDNETYRWGCRIASQDISYVYADKTVNNENATDGTIKKDPFYENMPEEINDDFLTTILALYQKYSCIALNESLHEALIESEDKSSRQIREAVKDLKRDAMEFRAYGTITPARVSRWNNICETYKMILEVNAVDETLDDIENKINLLNEWQEKISADNQNIFAMIIAVFGLVSIVASVLAIIDYISGGAVPILVGFGASSAGLFIFLILLIFIILRREK